MKQNLKTFFNKVARALGFYPPPGAAHRLYKALCAGDRPAVREIIERRPDATRWPLQVVQREEQTHSIISRDTLSPLTVAITHHKLGTARMLLDREPGLANVPDQSPNGDYPMHKAAWVSAKAVDLLLEFNADINAQNKRGETPLMLARDEESAEMLLQRKPNVNVASHDGRTALMLLARRGFHGTVESLLLNGADVNAKDDRGKTALTHALDSFVTSSVALEGKDALAAACLLLQWKADIDPADPLLKQALTKSESYKDSMLAHHVRMLEHRRPPPPAPSIKI